MGRRADRLGGIGVRGADRHLVGGDDGPGAVEPPPVVDEWSAAFVDEDPEALAALYAADATFSCRAWDFTIDAVEIPDVVMGAGTDFVEFEPTTVLVGDEVIVAEYAVNGVSPSGQSVATPLLAVFELAPNGLLAGSTIDDDRAAMFPTAPDETRHSSGPMPERHPAQAAPASESSSDSASTPPAR